MENSFTLNFLKRFADNGGDFFKTLFSTNYQAEDICKVIEELTDALSAKSACAILFHKEGELSSFNSKSAFPNNTKIALALFAKNSKKLASYNKTVHGSRFSGMLHAREKELYGFTYPIFSPIVFEGENVGAICFDFNKKPELLNEHKLLIEFIGSILSVPFGRMAEYNDKTHSDIFNNIMKNENTADDHANTAKNDFLSRMSHEIRTPINAIMGLSRMARNAESLAVAKKNLDRIDMAGRQLMNIVDDILDMSKISSNKMRLDPERFDFEKMLIDISNAISLDAEEKNQKLHIRMSMEMPRFYYGDSFRLSQVITNLLSNAIKFTPKGGKILVDIREAQRSGDISSVQVSVKDTGVGISPEAQKQLFSSFEQGDGGLTRQYGGTGLGLAICKSIIELMGGKISVTSEIDKGSRFVFFVKMQVLEDSEENIPKTIPSVTDEMTTLLIDDEEETCEYFQKIMEEYSICAKTAKSCVEGVAIVNESITSGNPVDIAFIDWHMPDIDGLETARRIKELCEDCYIVLVSAGDLSEIKDEALSIGVSKLISKPLFPSVLVDTINQLVGVTQISEGSAHRNRHSFAGASVLLVEDIEINKEVFCQDLVNTKTKIDWAINGEIAVNMFKQNPDKYDLIFMDIHMPGMDGYTATKTIRSLDIPRAATIPIVAMTANVLAEDIRKCKEAGMNDHLSKPIDVDRLFSVLNYYLINYSESSDDSKEESPMCNNDAKLSEAEIEKYINEQESLKRLGGNKVIFKTLLKSFLKNDQLAKLKAEIQSGNLEEACSTAHAIKGVSGNLSLIEVYKLSALLNTQLHSGLEFEQTFKEFEVAMAKTREAIEQYVQ